ncbi:MAG: hypothetical protein V1775_07230 [Bacteroidota bacterium]
MRLSGVKTENDPDMKCRDAELLIIDVLASGTQEPVPDNLSVHLLSCDSCSMLFAEYGKGFSNLAEGRKSGPDPAFYDNLVVAMKQQGHKTQVKTNPRRIFLYSPALAAAAASVMLGFWIGSRVIYPTLQMKSSESLPAVAEGSAMMQEYADDLYPEEGYTLMLEGYLAENENTDGDDTD